MIPVLIIPTLNGWERIPALLASVNVPVGRTVIVDNARTGRRLGSHDYLRPIANLGFAGSINAVVLQTPDAAWWMWASDDIAFGPSDLEAIAAHMDTHAPRVVTGTRNDERLLRFAYGAINRACIEAVGLLDEGFYPAYYEDDDYEYRCRTGGVSWITHDGAITHSRSATIGTDPALAAANARTFPLNHARYVAKWGGPPGSEGFSTPWGKPVPLSFSPPDIAGRAARTWGVPRRETK